jgi:hypothetical protein
LFINDTDPFIINAASDDDKDFDKIEKEKYHVPEDLDEMSMSILKNIIKDKEILRAEKAEIRKSRQIDF